MPRPAVVSAEQYLRLPTEAGMRRTIVEAVRVLHGLHWHVEDTRQCPEMTNFWDDTLLVPRPDGGATLYALELKSARRIVTPGQREVASLLGRVDRVVAGIVRAAPKDGELGFDQIVRMLEGRDG